MSPQLLPLFLWLSVLGWCIVLGAKLFDLIVVTGAWSAAPPQSLAFFPYGPRFRVNPGHFFLPLTFIIVTGAIGALVAGWGMPTGYCLWLWGSAAPVAGLWLVTIPVMWPLNAALYSASRAAHTADPAEVLRMARRWVICDWLRVVMVSAGFVSAVRAISLPIPR
jgi:hypothetical protein